MNVRALICMTGILLAISACVPKSVSEPRNARIRHLWSVMMTSQEDAFSLNPQVKSICHKKIRDELLPKDKINDFSVVKEFAPMEFATSLYADSAAKIEDYEQKTSMLNTVFFMTQYKGPNALGFNTKQNFVCWVELKNNYLTVPRVMSQNVFKYTGVGDTQPFAW